jgi:hypothetical protein
VIIRVPQTAGSDAKDSLCSGCEHSEICFSHLRTAKARFIPLQSPQRFGARLAATVGG